MLTQPKLKLFFKINFNTVLAVLLSHLLEDMLLLLPWAIITKLQFMISIKNLSLPSEKVQDLLSSKSSSIQNKIKLFVHVQNKLSLLILKKESLNAKRESLGKLHVYLVIQLLYWKTINASFQCKMVSEHFGKEIHVRKYLKNITNQLVHFVKDKMEVWFQEMLMET